MGAILAADFGSIYTRLVLLDLVDDGYRLVAQAQARTTSGFPHQNVSVGLERALREMSAVTGRALLNEQGRLITPEQPDRSGVDEFVATASVGRPLRTLLVGLVPDISIASGLRAAAGTYVQIVGTFSLSDTRSEEEKLNVIVSTTPDMVLITGGTEYGAREPLLDLIQVIHLALKLLERPRRPVILYAGNSALAPQIQAMFGDLTKVFIAPNVRPSLDDENLDGAQLQLGLAFNAFKGNRGGGFEVVSEMTRLGVLPTAQGYNLLTEYLGKSLAQGVLAVDIGSAVSSLSAYVGDDVFTMIRTDIGQGQSADDLLDTVGTEPVRRWLPFYISDDELLGYARNKALRPATIPETLRDLYIEHALLRAGIQELVAASRPAWAKQIDLPPGGILPQFDPIIGAGATLTQTGSGGMTALLLLDALQPEGVTTLQTDAYGLLPVLGALAYSQPEAVVQTIEAGGLVNIGTSFSLSGQPRLDRPALDVKIVTDDETVEQRIDGGHLWVYPLPSGQEAQVEVRVLARGSSIGGKGRIKLTLEGGTGGLIFDARGRLLPLAQDVRKRAAQMTRWLAEATRSTPQDIPESWLQAADQPPAPVRAARRLRRLGEPQESAETPMDDRLKETRDQEMDDIRNALS
ncbi:MAG: glutamate mutase L [Anaerolineae bacterium]|nr:glutamate mutase L [Anaerolineae bacterium]